MKKIYLDFNASTPIAAEVAAAMRPFLTKHFGNPSSTHWAGAPAKGALEQARTQVAQLLGCSPEEIVFTSGGSEANNAALKGAFFAQGRRRKHIVTTAIEHPATLNPCQFLSTLGATVTYLAVDREGRVDPADVAKAITAKTLLVSVMHANNEVGSIQPLAKIGRITRARGVLFHTDAAQSVGKIPTQVDQLGVDLLSIAGHKLYAPKGVGALYVRKGVQLEPLVHGAGHEHGRRAGTENVMLNVGLGAACKLAQRWINNARVGALCEEFWGKLQDAFGSRVMLNGHPRQRLPNTLNVSFANASGAEILGQIKNVAASTGSACHSGQIALSPVLKAMGVKPEQGLGAIRFSLGRSTTRAEIEQVLRQLKQVLS